MLFTWFMLTGFIFLFAPRRLTDKFQFAFVRIFRWPLSIGRNISLSTRIEQPLADADRLTETQYQNYIANLEEQLRQKHQKFEELSKFRDRFYALEGAGFVVADVIRVTIDASRSELIINRGQYDGLTRGQFVLGSNSIVGTISDIDWRQARVKLFTDTTSRIAVKIAELNVNRIMQGRGGNSAKVRMLSTEHEVEVGDKVYAGKKAGFLGTRLIIGTVTQCKEDDEPFIWDITVEPVCDIEKLNNVAVIIMNPQ